ncbi:MAG: hypothetical protein ACKVX7_12120 [Planctomycetota bacterium]
MDCDGLILTDSNFVEASEHEFDLSLSDEETYEYSPPTQQPRQKVVMRYTLTSRAFVDAKIATRLRSKTPIELCRPSREEKKSIQAAIRAQDFAMAIELSTKALGIERVVPGVSVEYDPTILDPEQYGGSSEDRDGRFLITLGPPALRDAPILLSTILHEAIGHRALGNSPQDPEYSSQWDVEEIEALRIEAMAAEVLGLSRWQIARIEEAAASRLAALEKRNPDLKVEIEHKLASTEYVKWISCDSDSARSESGSEAPLKE